MVYRIHDNRRAAPLSSDLFARPYDLPELTMSSNVAKLSSILFICEAPGENSYRSSAVRALARLAADRMALCAFV
jgi:hypothetical protein